MRITSVFQQFSLLIKLYKISKTEQSPLNGQSSLPCSSEPLASAFKPHRQRRCGPMEQSQRGRPSPTAPNRPGSSTSSSSSLSAVTVDDEEKDGDGEEQRRASAAKRSSLSANDGNRGPRCSRRHSPQTKRMRLRSQVPQGGRLQMDLFAVAAMDSDGEEETALEELID